MGFPRQEYWSGLPFPSLRDLSNPGIKPASPAFLGRFFTAEPSEKPGDAIVKFKPELMEAALSWMEKEEPDMQESPILRS